MKIIQQPINNLNIKKKKMYFQISCFLLHLSSNVELSGHQLDQRSVGDFAINRSISYIFKKVIISNKVFEEVECALWFVSKPQPQM